MKQLGWREMLSSPVAGSGIFFSGDNILIDKDVIDKTFLFRSWITSSLLLPCKQHSYHSSSQQMNRLYQDFLYEKDTNHEKTNLYHWPACLPDSAAVTMLYPVGIAPQPRCHDALPRCLLTYLFSSPSVYTANQTFLAHYRIFCFYYYRDKYPCGIPSISIDN